MKKTVLYNYLGTNGTITSPVHLEDIYYTRSYLLKPEPGYKLTKDGSFLTTSVIISEEDLDKWTEVLDPGQD
jgi:hypothetical protein